MRTSLGIIITALGALAACGDDTGSTSDNATSIPYQDGSPEAEAIKAVANDRSLAVAVYDKDMGLHGTAAKKLVAWRDGSTSDPGDDRDFETIKQVWAIPYCKASCLEGLLEYAKDNGYFGGGNSNISVIFSPQTGDATHLARIAKEIDRANDSIDIAMYSYSHQAPVKDALLAALDRGVKIRFLADTDLAVAAGKGGALENLGLETDAQNNFIDVRRVTKIMHHKFAIIDGPRDNATLDRADSAFIVTGSGNWSGSAATTYDENTLFMDGGYPELALRLQRDFDTLWAGSKDVVFAEGLQWDLTRGDITDALIADNEDDNVDAFLTSKNFKPTSGGGWSVLGTTVVTDGMVAGIKKATESIHIASGHFLNEPIAAAIRDQQIAHPDLVVDILLDCQEAGVGGAIEDLKDSILEHGGTIQYKCNTYRWHYTFAKQMHHKYMVIDGDELFTGSFNMSMNAETNTFENVLYFAGSEHAALVDAYLENHKIVRSYAQGNDNEELQILMDRIATEASVPLTWMPPISMDIEAFEGVKNAIRARCPATQSWTNTPEAKTYNKHFSKQPQWFDACSTTGYPWPKVPSHLREP